MELHSDTVSRRHDMNGEARLDTRHETGCVMVRPMGSRGRIRCAYSMVNSPPCRGILSEWTGRISETMGILTDNTLSKEVLPAF